MGKKSTHGRRKQNKTPVTLQHVGNKNEHWCHKEEFISLPQTLETPQKFSFHDCAKFEQVSAGLSERRFAKLQLLGAWAWVSSRRCLGELSQVQAVGRAIAGKGERSQPCRFWHQSPKSLYRDHMHLSFLKEDKISCRNNQIKRPVTGNRNRRTWISRRSGGAGAIWTLSLGDATRPAAAQEDQPASRRRRCTASSCSQRHHPLDLRP